jgi:hypothetical protein
MGADKERKWLAVLFSSAPIRVISGQISYSVNSLEKFHAFFVRFQD